MIKLQDQLQKLLISQARVEENIKHLVEKFDRHTEHQKVHNTKIEHTLHGNGKKGIVQEVREHRIALLVVKWLLGSGIIASVIGFVLVK